MKLGLISDVHGDPLALELAWAHLTTLGVDRILCAGDVVGYGPYPDRVIDFLNEHQIASVRGNHDRWAVERGLDGIDEFGGGKPGRKALEFLRARPTELVFEGAGRVGVVVHGSPGNDMQYILRRTHSPAVLRGYLKQLDADLLISGHTHQPMWYRAPDGRLVINPGSTISVPAVRTSRTFALVDLSKMDVSFHDVESGRTIELAPWPDDGLE